MQSLQFKKLLMAQIWGKVRLPYFKSKGDEDKVIDTAKKLKVIKKEIKDVDWEK